MGHQSIVYGRIQEDWEGTSVGWPRTPEYNNGVLESLPDADDDWPFLTRHLFATAPRSFHNRDRGEYRGRIIHFAASYKDSSDDKDWPDQFADKLERLVLSKMLWRSAKVHFESTFFPERVLVYRARKESNWVLRTELEMSRFGERCDACITWDRQETTLDSNNAPWLY